MTEANQATVLVVDDEPVNIELIHQSLKAEYRIQAVTSGEMALKVVSTSPLPDLVVLDIMMPGMDGYEVCRRLKVNPVTADVPVIFLTAKFEVEDEARGFREGAVDFIHKPISPSILQARVRTHLALKHARDMLRQQNQLLEEMVRQRTVELERALEQAVAAGKAKTAFLQTMSHELRTPLNHILGYAEILEEELEGKAEQIKDLNRIRASGKHLLEMIACVLDYANNEGASDLERKETSVAQVVRLAADRCQELFAKNDNQLEMELGPGIVISTDPKRLQFVITELLRNAAKFTGRGRITVAMRAETEADGRKTAVLEVADTGIGMTPEQAEHCFDAFWQADGSVSRSYGGTGMGLASARQIVQQLGGELTVQSEPGRGSTFRLSLPV